LDAFGHCSAILLSENAMLLHVVLALSLITQVRPPEKGSVSGTVVDSVTHRPLNKVHMSLEPLDRKATHIAVTVSDAKGRFELLNVNPGTYRLRAKRNGYLEMAYRARRPNSDGALVKLEAGQFLDGVKFELTPAAVIAGTVRDSDGEPLEGAHVTLARFAYEYGPPRVEGYDSTETDDRGEYRFRGLVAGKYYVGVETKSHGWYEVDHSPMAGPNEKSAPTIYPGVPDISMATPVEVPPGGRATGIDITLLRSRVFRVRGRVTNAPGSSRLAVALRDPKNAGIRNYDMRTAAENATGDFELRGVPPGSYVLAASAGPLSGTAAVTVSGSDVEGVRISLAPGSEVKLLIGAESDEKPDLSGLDYFLTSNGRSGFSPNPFTGNDRFTIRNVPPDHYILRLSGNLLERFYVKAARAGESDVLADGLKVEGPAAITIEIVLASDGAAVAGLVKDASQHPVSGATVLLAPDRRSRADLFRTTTTDQHGRFEFSAIAPGDYKVFAWEDVEPGLWHHPEFLKHYDKQGEKVALEARSRTVIGVSLAVHPNPE
jgi:protocatechuate 3,4-dioxygenase beta subunit